MTFSSFNNSIKEDFYDLLLQVQGVKEHYETDCDELRTWVSNVNYFAAFSEGWATYIEKDVADLDMNVYDDDMQRYGMLKHQVLFKTFEHLEL
jgi:uncharacterized protein (DUF885 family)